MNASANNGKTIKELIDEGVKMAKTEQRFYDFLSGLKKADGSPVRFKWQKPIEGCPFVKKGKHKVDFYIEDLELYIEVKGWMSYASVNELEYLLRYSGKNFYILQVTNEDWMGMYEKAKHSSANKKIELNTKQQLNEIADFIEGKVTAKDMSVRSLKRLNDFKDLRAGDIGRWLKAAKKEV